MGQDDVIKMLSDIVAADALSYWIVGGLTVLVFLVMRAMLPVKGLAIVFTPPLFWGGLAGIYAASQVGLVFSTEKSAQIVATSVIGMTVALILMVLLVRFIEAVIRIRTPLTNSNTAGRTRA